MKGLWSGALATAVAATAYAQAPVINAKLAELQPDKLGTPLCSLKPQGPVQRGLDALKKSFDAKADKAAKLEEAKTLILEGIATGQGQSAAAWYYLGRVYLQLGDVGGVDSALTKAQALQPQCEIEIGNLRQNNWALLANHGIELQQKGDIEGAIVQLRDASRLFDGLPQVVQNLGVLFANSSQDDSAAAYFGKAFAIADQGAASDTALAADRNLAAFNLGLMYQRLERHSEAVPILRKYLSWDPKNVDARKMLAASFRGAGMADSAEALDNAMFAELSKKNLDSLDTGDIMNVGVAAFNAKRYDEAADAFAKVVSRIPYSRDAVYNLANVYLALGSDVKKQADTLRNQAERLRKAKQADSADQADSSAAKLEREAEPHWKKLVEVASRLEAIEPMNEDVYRLVGMGHRGLGHDDEVLAAATKLVALPVNVEMRSFQLGKDRARLQGVATGRSPTDAQGKDIKPEPFVLVLEFVTVSGQLVDSKEVSIPVVQDGASHNLNVEGKGADIAAWRYRRK
jgi:tetratricopeptide (TPR) repeat protein